MAGDRIFLIPKAEQKEVQLMISLFNEQWDMLRSRLKDRTTRYTATMSGLTLKI